MSEEHVMANKEQEVADEERQEEDVEEEVEEQANESEGEGTVDEETVIDALKECYDPEIPVNLYDLGLIYEIEIDDELVDITMTLTAPGCGFGPQIKQQVVNRMKAIDGVEEAEVEIVHEPRWDRSMVTEEGKEQLGMMGF